MIIFARTRDSLHRWLQVKKEIKSSIISCKMCSSNQIITSKDLLLNTKILQMAKWFNCNSGVSLKTNWFHKLPWKQMNPVVKQKLSRILVLQWWWIWQVQESKKLINSFLWVCFRSNNCRNHLHLRIPWSTLQNSKALDYHQHAKLNSPQERKYHWFS